jgi:hypothetical protein
VHPSLAVKGRRQGERRPFIEQKHGEDLHHDSGEWRQRDMVVDRDNDEYSETIVSPSLGVVRDVKEPRSDHQVHGSAKRSSEDVDGSSR